MLLRQSQSISLFDSSVHELLELEAAAVVVEVDGQIIVALTGKGVGAEGNIRKHAAVLRA